MFKTGISVIDVWTLVHFSFWIFAGSTLWAFGLRDNRIYSACLLTAAAWEVFERYAEPRWPTVWRNPESLVNSASDVVTCIVGVWLIWTLLDKAVGR